MPSSSFDKRFVIPNDDVADRLIQAQDRRKRGFAMKFDEWYEEIGEFTNDVVRELINRRRRQLLLHSFLYYRMNTTLISDHTYDSWARELMRLQTEYPTIASECIHADDFANFSETTSGYNLPLYGWVQAVAERLLRYQATLDVSESLEQSLNEVKLMREGTLPKKSWRDMLAEIKNDKYT